MISWMNSLHDVVLGPAYDANFQHGLYWHICFGRRVARVRCSRSCLPIFPSASTTRSGCFWLRLVLQAKRLKLARVDVLAFWLPVGKNEGRVVLQFAGIDTISDAESIAGNDVLVPREERLPLDDESVYISELIGCTVYDGPLPVGVVEDVQFAMTADGGRRLEDAAPLLSVRSLEGDEVLIPFAKAFLVAVDTEAKRIDMTLPQGLIDVNRPVAGNDAKSEDQKR